MSIESMAVVLHHSKARGTDKLVLVGIANHDGDGGAWPSVATLARYANVEPRAVRKIINKLIDLGEVERDKQAGGTRNMPDYTRPNLYHIKVTCPAECDRSAQHRINRSEFDFQRAEIARIEGVSNRTGGVQQDSRPTVPQDRGALSHRTAKPSLEPSTELDKSSSRSSSPGDNGQLPCWNCGRHVIANTTKPKRYCTECSSRGMNSPLIPCTGCGSVRKRAYPGEQDFDCGCNNCTTCGNPVASAACMDSHPPTPAQQWDNITEAQREQLRNNHHEIDRTNR